MSRSARYLPLLCPRSPSKRRVALVGVSVTGVVGVGVGVGVGGGDGGGGGGVSVRGPSRR